MQNLLKSELILLKLCTAFCNKTKLELYHLYHPPSWESPIKQNAGTHIVTLLYTELKQNALHYQINK